MTCPHCRNEINSPGAQCPFCNAPLTPSVDSDVTADFIFEEDQEDAPFEMDAEENLKGAIHAPHEDIETEKPVEKPTHPVMAPIDCMADEPALSLPPIKRESSPFKFIVIALAAIGAYQIGLLDNLLISIGLLEEKTTQEEMNASVEKPAGAAEDRLVETDDDADIAIEPEAARPAARIEKTVPAAEPVSTPPVIAQKPEPTEEEPAPKKDLPMEWWFYGKMYDLLSLNRIPDVDMVFIGGDQDFNVKTNAQGEFKVRLPILAVGGYELIVERAGFHEHYLVDKEPSYESMTENRRSQLWGAIPPKPKQWKGSRAKWHRQDLILFPVADGR